MIEIIYFSVKKNFLSGLDDFGLLCAIHDAPDGRLVEQRPP